MPMRYLMQHGLEESVHADSARLAAVDGPRSLRYGELEEQANRLAHLLVDRGVRRGDRVGLYLEKSLESLIGIFGVLKAGAVYVPLDHQAPASRLGYIGRDCGIRVLITSAAKADDWGELRAAGMPLAHVIVPDAAEVDADVPASIGVSTARSLAEQDRECPRLPTIGSDLAYILYTSGSTGVPKGVMLSHTNGLAFVEWAVGQFLVDRDDRLSSHAPLHFDLSIFDVFAAATAGAAVVLVPAETSYFPVEVARFIERQAITVWYSVPSVLNMIVERGHLQVGRFSTLRTMLFAGEVFPTKYLRRLMGYLPHVRFCNLYGPTETNVCTWYEVPPIPEQQTEPIPIGQAIGGVEVFAVTEQGEAARAGELGELYVRGPTVMQGYWGDRERTSASLVDNPLGGIGRELVYRTGDLVEQLPSGDYRLLGRRDHQIKSRGYRIELGDIESALYAHPAVVECAVMAIPDPMITNTIVAFVVLRSNVERSDLIDFCASRLPHYMVPHNIDIRMELPKTSTGKIDRQALTPSDAQ
jgi:amino acid adenylation domain-containing protein